MRRWTHMILVRSGLILAAAGVATAQTVVENFVVIEADRDWVFAPGRQWVAPSRTGEVITASSSERYKVARIEFAGRRASSGTGTINLPIRSARHGIADIVFGGRSDSLGTGVIAFQATRAPGVRGTIRRIGTLDLPGIPPVRL